MYPWNCHFHTHYEHWELDNGYQHIYRSHAYWIPDPF